jgi:hypothetical protein
MSHQAVNHHNRITAGGQPLFGSKCAKYVDRFKTARWTFRIDTKAMRVREH